MFKDYIFKKPKKNTSALVRKSSTTKGGLKSIFTILSFALLSVTSLQARTTISDSSKNESMVNSTTAFAAIAAAQNGSWNDPATWVGGVVPGCGDTVTIGALLTVTVNSAGNTTGNLTIATFGTLIVTSGDLTVSNCSGNNVSFINNGILTVNGGTLTVNGSVLHASGSTFNQTAGSIVVDGNDGGNAGTSVSGTSIFLINTSLVNLTGGSITIVDPLLGATSPAYTATLASTANINTAAGPSVFTTTGVTGTSGTTSVTINAIGQSFYKWSVGQQITGTGIAPGTTVASVTIPLIGNNVGLTLSQPLTGNIVSADVISFSIMANGQYGIVLDGTNASVQSLGIGNTVTGTGIPGGTTIVSLGGGISGDYAIILSNPVSGLGTSPINALQNLTFSNLNVIGSNKIVLTAPLGGGVGANYYAVGTGIPNGSVIQQASGNTVILTNFLTALPTTVDFYAKNNTNVTFGYNGGTTTVKTSANHTLNLGNGVSTDNGSSAGFVVNTQMGTTGSTQTGVFCIGNLNVNTGSNATRGVYISRKFNVQGNLTVATGSVLSRYISFSNGATATPENGVYFGGNITNNGTIYSYGTVYFGNSDITTSSNPIPATTVQTVLGSGSFINFSTSNVVTGAIGGLTINNPLGVTLQVPNFRVVGTVTLTDGILHTSDAYPLQTGVLGSTGGTTISGTFSNTRYIDGPIERWIGNNTLGSGFFPVGTGGVYLPMWVQITGGANIKGKAVNSNGGSASASIANLASKSWVATRIGVDGALTDYQVTLGDAGIASNSIVVQAPTANGVYDSNMGIFATYTAGTPNTTKSFLTTSASQAYQGYFSYATQAGCNIIAPGNTITSANNLTCAGQYVNLSFAAGVVAGDGISYQWQQSTNSGSTWTNISGATTSTTTVLPMLSGIQYRCNVTCSYTSNSVASNPVTITFASALTSTTPGTACAGSPATLGATASSGTIYWYANDSLGGASLGSGPSFVTPVLNANATYYAAAETRTNYSGQGPLYSGTNTYNAVGGQAFNLSQRTLLKSVKVYPAQKTGQLNSDVTIQLCSLVGTTWVPVPGYSVTFTPTANQTNTTPTTNGVSQVVNLNFDIPQGNNYAIFATSGISTNNRLGSITSGFTFTDFGPISFLGSVPGLTGTPNNTRAYFFFDYDVTSICASGKQAVAATVDTTCSTILPASCGVTYNNLNSYLYSSLVRYAEGYRWRVKNLTTNEIQTADTPLRQFRVIMLSNFAYNTDYEVEVAVKLAGVWGAYSSTCTFSTGEPTTQMVNCAATPASMTTQNTCNIVQFAKGYRFELTNGEDVTTFDNTIRQFSLSQVTGIMPGTTYSVRVAVQNTDSSYMAYGPTCTITSPGMAPAATTKFARTSGEVVSSDFNVVSFPNPFANSFAVNVSSISQEKVQIKVYDMVGRLVEQRNANVSELESTQIGNNYQSGIYNVIVSQGENVKTLRVIKR